MSPSTRSSIVSRAVSMRIGAVKPEARSLRVSVMPSVSGSPTSRMTRSKVERSMRSRASRPVEAVSGAQPDVGKDVGIVVDDENADAHESASFLISLPAGMLRLAACARHCAALDRLSVRSHLGRRVVDCTPSMPSTVE